MSYHLRSSTMILQTQKYSLLLIGVLLLLASAPAVSAQTQPEHKLVEFHMALLKHGPKWTTTDNAEKERLKQEHLKYVMSLLDSGKVIIAGPFTDGGEITGVFIFRAQSAAEAKTLVDADPTVAAGLQIPEMHPWWSEDIFSKPAKPLKLVPMYFAFLTRGEKWTPEKTPATEE